MQTTAEPRVRKRIPCTLRMEARRHNGMVLNLSARGLFVQTSLPAEPGTRLDLKVHDPALDQTVPLEAAVVWRRRVSPRMTGVNQSGMGLRLLSRPAQWQNLMNGLLGIEAPIEGATNATPPVEVEGEPEVPLFRFDVRLRQSDSQRSRRVVVRSVDEAAAQAEALAIVGKGWAILEVRRR